MDNQPTITLHYVRKDGRRERTKLAHHTLSEAREVAKWVLHVGNGLYTEVDICPEDGHIETIQNAVVPAPMSTIPEVLLVEDNLGDALLLRQALADCPIPVHLQIARDGEEALQKLGEPDFQPDLIILDLNIPKISGFTVLASYLLKRTPVVVFTASSNEADAYRAFSLGALECVHKPIDLDDYKTAVCGMVQKWAAPKESTGRTEKSALGEA
jgi:two-component system, chemotaxis family, response regulator Rcp1